MSATSHRLPYGKPFSIQEQDRPMPQTPERIDPVAYIRCWDKYNHGEPVDITKAKPMNREHLMKADPRAIELMLQYGVTQKQLAMQYNIPFGSITAIFKRLGVVTNLPSMIKNPSANTPENPEPPNAPTILEETGNEPDDSSSDPIAAADDGMVWFDQRPQRASNAVTVRKDGKVQLGANVAKLFGDNVKIGISRDGRNLKIVSFQSGLILRKDKAGRVVAIKALANEIEWAGVTLPARYVGDGQANEWTGTLDEISGG